MSYHVQYYAGYVPVRVIARMDEPIMYLGDLLHLDGPLSYAAFHALDERTRRSIEPFQTAAFPIDLRLPLSTWWVDYQPQEHGEIDDRLLKHNRRDPERRSCEGLERRQLWGHCASAVDESSWSVRGKMEVRKRPALDRMRRYTAASSMHLSLGHMKAYNLAFPTVFTREVVWYAHGDADQIRALLSTYVPALGKKRHQGNGTVREWIVEPIDRDRSIVDPAGNLARRMPFGAVAGTPRSGAIRSPYYHHTRVVMAVEPC